MAGPTSTSVPVPMDEDNTHIDDDKERKSGQAASHQKQKYIKIGGVVFAISCIVIGLTLGLYYGLSDTANCKSECTTPSPSSTAISSSSPTSSPLPAQSVAPPQPTNTDVCQSGGIMKDVETILSYGTRVAGSGSSGWTNAAKFIASRINCYGDVWDLSYDNFTMDTILGSKSFSNIIASLKGGNVSNGHYVLAAHFDSKLFTEITFLGACDSVVPLVINLWVQAQVALLVRSNSSLQQALPMIRVVFFDGEEAFKAWTSTDSIYGARHLASVWEQSGILRTLNLFVLLDLLGPTDSVPVPNYFGETTTYYEKLQVAEASVTKRGTRRDTRTFFPTSSLFGGGIEDDHIPFYNRNVPILHLIRAPFPQVWHSATDDLAHVDSKVTLDFADIMVEFVRSVFLRL